MASESALDPLFKGDAAVATRTLLRVTILILIAAAAVSARLFSVIRFESIIHEFDPWFNFRATYDSSAIGLKESVS
jgi:dolichyl-diphosphooligosaccharide--protein glycosyltransferase